MREYKPISAGVGIEHDRVPLEPGRDLREQLKPLACQRSFIEGVAGDIPTRAVERCDDTADDGVTHVHDDRDRLRLSLDGNGRGDPVCHDDVGLQADQLPRERLHPIDVTAGGPPKVHPHVAAIDPTQIRKRLRKRRKLKLRARVGHTAALPSPAMNSRLIRSPRGRAQVPWWNFEAERLCGFHVQRHLEFDRQLNRKVGRLCTVRYAVNIGCRLAKKAAREVRP
jgi:hypothetical protein